MNGQYFPAVGELFPLRTVALGGGHGLFSTLTALRKVTTDVTAVVTVADDGGSSGRLRRQRGLLPPGDLRQALAALVEAEDPHSMWADVLQYRFDGEGDLAGHPVGNLLLAGLFEKMADPVAALDEICRLLGVSGRVLPMSVEPLEIIAEVTGLGGVSDKEFREVRGQAAVAKTPGQVQRIILESTNSEKIPDATPQAIDAILGADVVFLGPGSWFTSVLPHLLIPRLRDALIATKATKVVILNLVPQPGETAGFSPERHLEVLFRHAPELRLDAIIADRASVPEPQRLRAAAAVSGAKAYLADVADSFVPGRHDPDALSRCLREALGLADESEKEAQWQ